MQIDPPPPPASDPAVDQQDYDGADAVIDRFIRDRVDIVADDVGQLRDSIAASLCELRLAALPQRAGLDADLSAAAKRVCVVLWGRERPAWETPIWDHCFAIARAALAAQSSGSDGEDR